jgi:ATP-dependent Clp protease ATP-binding subunit ClpB
MRKLYPELSKEAVKLQEGLEARIIGQDRAIRNLVQVLEIHNAGLHDPHRPIACLLYLGPSGCGKTETVRALAEILHGNKDSFLRINCELLQQEHTVGNLVGSAKGYVGYGDEAILSQKQLDKHRKEGSSAPSILLWDEIDKAANSILNVLLGIFDTGRVTLSNGQDVDLRNSIQICTCNLAAKELARLLSSSGLGFQGEKEHSATDDQIWKTSKEAVKKHMRPELIGRFTKIITFHSLSDKALNQILDIQINDIQKRLIDSKHLVLLRVTSDARALLIKEGTSQEYGARTLRKTIEKKVVVPLASILAAKSVQDGDAIVVSMDHEKLIFSCDPKKGALLKVKPEPPVVPITPDIPPVPDGEASAEAKEPKKSDKKSTAIRVPIKYMGWGPFFGKERDEEQIRQLLAFLREIGAI